MEDEPPVPGDAHVGLHPVAAFVEGGLERGRRVLGNAVVPAAVGEEAGAIGVSFRHPVDFTAFHGRMHHMKIYTKTGDTGETGLFGGGRVSKSHARVAAYGDVDELSTHLGLAATFVDEEMLSAEIRRIQEDLFVVGADLATPFEAGERIEEKTVRLDDGRVSELERLIDRLSEAAPALRHFILPGGTPAAAALQVARAVCRRAERSVVALSAAESVSPGLLVYLNRLSDLLFVMARYANAAAGVEEPVWKGKARGES